MEARSRRSHGLQLLHVDFMVANLLKCIGHNPNYIAKTCHVDIFFGDAKNSCQQTVLNEGLGVGIPSPAENI